MRKNAEMREGLKKIGGVVVNDNEGGNRFYHKHASPKARSEKAKARKRARKSRKRNRK